MEQRWPVLAELGAWNGGSAWLFRQAILVSLGVSALALAATTQVPMWPSPVPITMGTFAVLVIGAAFGTRLGLVTILCYMLVGALGADVFAGSSAESNGLSYMMGGTGGYLVGYVLATVVLGALARRGWDRNVAWMALAMLVGNVVLYIPGVAWLHILILNGLFDPAKFVTPWEQTLTWGLTPYLIGDAIKLALAALMLPGVWKLIGLARN
jgi:biotin transport system substrate-specific component